MESSKNLFYGKVTFFLLSITLIIGFFFNEDSSGSGGFVADFNKTWGYVEALKESFFVLPSKSIKFILKPGYGPSLFSVHVLKSPHEQPTLTPQHRADRIPRS